MQMVRELSLDSAAIKSWPPLYAPILIVVAFCVILIFHFGLIWLEAVGRAFSHLHGLQLASQTLLILLVVLKQRPAFHICSLASVAPRSKRAP